MIEILKQKLEELSIEARQLVSEREQAIRAVQDIEVRMHQVTGAMVELDKLINSVSVVAD